MNIMFDFETLDTRPTAVVPSLGVVLFDENEIVATKYFKFKMQEQIDDGRTVSASTLSWWLKQSPEAQSALHPQDGDASASLLYFYLFSFLDKHNVELGDLVIWGNGSDFDTPIANDLIKDQGELWKFYNTMCFRTFAKMTGCKKLAKREGTHHNALDDAIYQTNCVLAYWKSQKTR